MEYKLNILSLIILAGILGNGIHYELTQASELDGCGGAFEITKSDLSGEGFFYQHAISPLKKYSQGLFFEREEALRFFRWYPSVSIKRTFLSVSVFDVFGPVNINAP